MSRPTWGDAVRIRRGVAPEMRPGAVASVCGQRTAETLERARAFQCEIGTIVYLVELEDGCSLEIAAPFVELLDGEDA